jgi:hypothetical protein
MGMSQYKKSSSEKLFDLVMFSIDSSGIVRNTRAKENRPTTKGPEISKCKKLRFWKKG